MSMPKASVNCRRAIPSDDVLLLVEWTLPAARNFSSESFLRFQGDRPSSRLSNAALKSAHRSQDRRVREPVEEVAPSQRVGDGLPRVTFSSERKGEIQTPQPERHIDKSDQCGHFDERPNHSDKSPPGVESKNQTATAIASSSYCRRP
jgi:hypothetical protein